MFGCNNDRLNYSKWKNAVLNPSKSFLAWKKVNPRILSTFKRSSSKKMGKKPSSHVIHSLGGEYCWIVRDSEPIRLLKSPRSLSVYILTDDMPKNWLLEGFCQLGCHFYFCWIWLSSYNSVVVLYPYEWENLRIFCHQNVFYRHSSASQHTFCVYVMSNPNFWLHMHVWLCVWTYQNFFHTQYSYKYIRLQICTFQLPNIIHFCIFQHITISLINAICNVLRYLQ